MTESLAGTIFVVYGAFLIIIAILVSILCPRLFEFEDQTTNINKVNSQ